MIYLFFQFKGDYNSKDNSNWVDFNFFNNFFTLVSNYQIFVSTGENKRSGGEGIEKKMKQREKI